MNKDHFSPAGHGDALVSAAFSVIEMNRQHALDQYGDAEKAETWACVTTLRAALAARQPVAEQHPDDMAVDSFANSMKAKMAAARAKGRGGWEDSAQCSADALSRMLRDHVDKGDPRDVANFCMMLHQRGETIAACQPVGQEPVAEVVSAHGDPEAFGEREMRVLADLRKIPYGTKLYAALPAQQPAQAVDLGRLERIRNELHAMSKQVPDDWADPIIELQRDVQSLIDGKAVASG